jgi:uncharacterized metal-binding protein YceD (DUF177 family)
MPDQIPALEALRVDLAAMRRSGATTCPVDAVLPKAWLTEVLRDTDAELGNDAEVHLEVSLETKGLVLVRGLLSLKLTVPCGRCLAPAAVDGDTRIFATFMASAAAAETLLRQDEEGLEPDPDTPDVFAYDGPILSLEPMVAEQVALAYPMRALCERGEACRGLCSNCGQDLNWLPAAERRCRQCGAEVPLTPVADLPSSLEDGSDPQSVRDQRKAAKTTGEPIESPLAAALRKLKLE